MRILCCTKENLAFTAEQPDGVNRTSGDVHYVHSDGSMLTLWSLHSVVTIGELWIDSTDTRIAEQLVEWAQEQRPMSISRIYVVSPPFAPAPAWIAGLEAAYSKRRIIQIAQSDYFSAPQATQLAPAA